MKRHTVRKSMICHRVDPRCRQIPMYYSDGKPAIPWSLLRRADDPNDCMTNEASGEEDQVAAYERWCEDGWALQVSS